MKTKETFTIDDLKRAFEDGRLYEANELEFDESDDNETVFEDWFDWAF